MTTLTEKLDELITNKVRNSLTDQGALLSERGFQACVDFQAELFVKWLFEKYEDESQ